MGENSTIRFWLLTRLIAFYWWCERQLVNTPCRTRENIVYDPISTGTLISIIIASASFAANMLITMLSAPKAKPNIKGKLTGEIQVQDSIYGAPIIRIYGGRKDDGTGNFTPGGVEAGCNVIWMSEIRHTQTQTPGGGGGGKGGPRTPPNIQNHYKVDLAAIVSNGRKRLLRMKWNEDTVYSIIGGGPGTGTGTTRYEAEAAANTLTGTADAVEDLECSNDHKVTGIGGGSDNKLTINEIINNGLPPATDVPDPGLEPWFDITISYKSVDTVTYYVKLDGTGGTYVFPAVDGVGSMIISRRVIDIAEHSLEFSHPTSTGLEIDCIDVDVQYIEGEGRGPNGVRNEDFPAEDPQDNIALPDPKDEDTNAFTRYNTPDPPDPDVTGYAEIPLQNGASLGWYEGTATQEADAVIIAAVGEDSCPAFRDTCFFRLQDLDFTEYGIVPTIRCVVEDLDLQTVEEILVYEAGLAGLDNDKVDFSVADEMHCRGYFVADNGPPSKTVEDFALVFNLAFAENHDGKVVAIDLNDRTAVATIARADLGAYIAGDSNEVPLDDVVSTVPEEAEDLIRSLEFQFNNPLLPSDYNTDRRRYNYPFTDSQRHETKSVNMTMLSEEVGPVVRRELQKSHLQQAPDAFVTTHKWAWLNAGDCINLEIEAENHKRRIATKTGSAPGVYEMTAIDEDIWVMADDGSVIEEAPDDDTHRIPNSTTRYPANSVGTIMDIPFLVDEHKGLGGVYVAACSKGTGRWSGCQVNRLKGVDYSPMCTLTKEAGIGRTVVALPAPPPPGEGFDSEVGDLDASSVITVDFFGDFNPTTVTNDQAIDGANPFCVGNEVLIIRDWERDNDFPNRWIGTNMYRALKHTTLSADGHATVERVVLLDDAIKFVPLDEDEIGVERSWKFVTSGGLIDDAAEIVFTWDGLNVYNTELEAPVIGQVFAAEQLLIRIGVRGYTDNALWRKIEVSASADMSSAEEVTVTADEFPDSVLPPEFLLTRASGSSTLTRYVRVSHSSNGSTYGEVSNILTVTFTNSAGSGGTSGSFSPNQDYTVQIS